MEGRAAQPRRGPDLKMLIDLGGEVFDQLLLGRHGLDQSLELGGRDGGLDRSRGDRSGSDRSRSGGDRGIDGGTGRRSRFAEGSGQADVCHVSFPSTVVALDRSVSAFAVCVCRRSTPAAPFVHDLSPFVPFLGFRGEGGEYRVKPVSINVHGVWIAKWR